MDTNTLPKGRSAESNDGRPNHEPGIYEHKETKVRFITAEGNEGSIQADSLMSPVWKDSWQRVGDVPSRVELLKMQKTQLIKDEASEKIEKQLEEEELKERVDLAVKGSIDDVKADKEKERK